MWGEHERNIVFAKVGKGLPQTATGCHKTPQTAKELHRLPKTATGCLPQTATDCQRVPRNVTGCHRVPLSGLVWSGLVSIEGFRTMEGAEIKSPPFFLEKGWRFHFPPGRRADFTEGPEDVIQNFGTGR